MKYARRCDECGAPMNEGFVIEGGQAYFCSEACLHKEISEPEYLELYNEGEGDTYWTEWEEVDEDFYYDEEGNEIFT